MFFLGELPPPRAYPSINSRSFDFLVVIFFNLCFVFTFLFLFLLPLYFFFLAFLDVYMGFWRAHVALVVSSTIAWHGVALSPYCITLM